MGADDVWGHTYVDVIGRCYQTQQPPKAWVVHYNFRENDGFTFVRRGAERQVEVELNPIASSEDIDFLLQGYDKGLFTLYFEESHDSKKDMQLAMLIVRDLLKSGAKSSTVSEEDLEKRLKPCRAA